MKYRLLAAFLFTCPLLTACGGEGRDAIINDHWLDVRYGARQGTLPIAPDEGSRLRELLTHILSDGGPAYTDPEGVKADSDIVVRVLRSKGSHEALQVVTFGPSLKRGEVVVGLYDGEGDELELFIGNQELIDEFRQELKRLHESRHGPDKTEN
jgi:hypothetical protein